MHKLTCIVCPIGCSLSLDKKGDKWIVSGNSCPKGLNFALNEAVNPKRSLSSTVRTTIPEMPRLPVRTDGEIPKGLIFDVMELINRIVISRPAGMGEVIIDNVLDTGVNIVSTCDMISFCEGA